MVSESMTGAKSDVLDARQSPEALLEASYRQWVQTPVGQRDRDQADQIFRQFESRFGKLIRKIIFDGGPLSAQCVDDIYQETFTTLFSLRSFSEEMNLLQLIYSVTRNVSLMYIRKTRAKKRGEGQTFQFQESPDSRNASWQEPADFSWNLDPVIRQELIEYMGAQFSNDDLIIFVSRVHNHETFDALALQFGKNERTIRRICERIMIAVRRFLLDEGTNMSLPGDSAGDGCTDDLRKKKPR